MKPVSRAIAAAFANSAAYTSGKYLLIDTDNEMAFELLKNNERRQEIRQLILETTGQHYNLGPYKRPSAKQEEKTDPVDKLIESLQGSDVIITQESKITKGLRQRRSKQHSAACPSGSETSG